MIASDGSSPSGHTLASNRSNCDHMTFENPRKKILPLVIGGMLLLLLRLGWNRFMIKTKHFPFPSNLTISGGCETLDCVKTVQPHVVHQYNGTGERPPLSSLIDGDEIIADNVDWLLDFAIVGHSKCATTEHMHWLADHPQVQMYRHELHYLGSRQPGRLVKDLYNLKEGDEYLRGYKSPHELQRIPAVKVYRKYFTRAKLIVGVRHPVRWFESMYNFNWRMGNPLPPAETYVGEKFHSGVTYHEHLARLGKTNLSDPKEFYLLGRNEPEVVSVTDIVSAMPNPVFLYEISQAFDNNLTRRTAYAEDLSNFLGLSPSLDPWEPSEGKGPDYHFKIDICDDQYDALRAELVAMGTNASLWLRQYFLKLPDVTVSSPIHFDELIRTWSSDPCET